MNLSGGFEVFHVLIVLLVFGIFLFTLIKNISQWNKNNHSPKLTVDATVVTKRTNHSRHHSGSTNASTSSTTYYATFQVESGDRIEFCMSGLDYGMLAEGDYGKLSFQGTRYLGFER